MSKYNYEQFKQKLLEQLQAELGEDAELCVTVVRRNNQREKEGIYIRKAGINMVPVLFLSDLYEEYRAGGKMEMCVERIINATDRKSYQIPNILPEWDVAKEQLQMYLVKKEWNEEWLAEVPHQECCDLVLLCRVIIAKADSGTAFSNVTYSTLDYWGIEQEELWKAAWKKLNEEEFEIRDIVSLIGEIAGNTEELEECEIAGVQYVMTNPERQYGAAGLLRKDMLKQFAMEKGCSFYILPSSLHEIILMPDRGNFNTEELKEMVKEVNATFVEREEWLSDTVYYFNCETEKVECMS